METQPVCISDVAKIHHLKASTLQKQYKDFISNFKDWKPSIDEDNLIYPENFSTEMSIDETTLQNGELYTILTNKKAKGKKGVLAALIKGTKSEIISKALSIVPIKTRMAVKEITLDLANSMDWICRINFPGAIHTADRFHFQKIISEAVQEIRIQYRRKAIDEENIKILEARKQKTQYHPEIYSNGDTKRQLLARSRHLLFKTKKNWTHSQLERAKILFKNFPEIQKAYELSMYFRGIFERRITKDEGKKQLERWYKKVNVTKLSTMISASNTIKNNEGKILNYFHSRSTNASAESFNAKLKGFRSLLRGITDMKFFLYRVETLFA